MIEKNKYLCECKAVKVNEIKRAVRVSNAESLIDIQNLTKASTGCGKCKPLVLSFLESELKKKNMQGRQLKLDF